MRHGLGIARIGLLLLAAALLIVKPEAANAQTDGVPPPGAITIGSNPPGALVYLTGEYRFIGRTPFVLPYTLYGNYRIQANRLGYESVTSQYNFTGETGNSRLTIKLAPRTKLKALYRSALVPGWGQYYSGRKSIGTVLLGATAGASVALAIQQHNYSNSQSDYEAAQAKFIRAGASFEEQNEAFNKLQSALQHLGDAKDARDTNLYILGGLWLLNVIESAVFFPNQAQHIEFFQKLTPSASQGAKGVKFTMQIPIK